MGYRDRRRPLRPAWPAWPLGWSEQVQLFGRNEISPAELKSVGGAAGLARLAAPYRCDAASAGGAGRGGRRCRDKGSRCAGAAAAAYLLGALATVLEGEGCCPRPNYLRFPVVNLSSTAGRAGGAALARKPPLSTGTAAQHGTALRSPGPRVSGVGLPGAKPPGAPPRRPRNAFRASSKQPSVCPRRGQPHPAPPRRGHSRCSSGGFALCAVGVG